MSAINMFSPFFTAGGVPFFGTFTAGAATAGFGFSAPASSPDYILAGNLGGALGPSSSGYGGFTTPANSAQFLSNATFAADTTLLLNNPAANGALFNAAASAYVASLIQGLDAQALAPAFSAVVGSSAGAVVNPAPPVYG